MTFSRSIFTIAFLVFVFQSFHFGNATVLNPSLSKTSSRQFLTCPEICHPTQQMAEEDCRPTPVGSCEINDCILEQEVCFPVGGVLQCIGSVQIKGYECIPVDINNSGPLIITPIPIGPASPPVGTSSLGGTTGSMPTMPPPPPAPIVFAPVIPGPTELPTVWDRNL